MINAQLFAALAGSYLIGSIPTGYLLVRWIKQADVRTMGSGNVGATNVTRVAGSGAGRVVFLLDLAKGLLVVWALAPWLAPTLKLACGVLAVLGHCFPVWLAFRGGKGVATTIGVLIGTMPLIASLCLAVWLICFLLWRYVSLASLAMLLVLPLAQFVAHQPRSDIGLGIALGALILVRHQSNIERLLRGTEHRWGKG